MASRERFGVAMLAALLGHEQRIADMVFDRLREFAQVFPARSNPNQQLGWGLNRRASIYGDITILSSCVEVDDDTIRIIGGKAALDDVIAGRSGVRSLVREWRALRDSNS
jgi:hypothetical protein